MSEARTAMAGAALALLLALAAGPAPAQTLPNPRETPGALFVPQVTQATIDSTICKPGWPEGIAPPRWYIDDLKRRQLARGPYARPHARPEDYAEDHRVPLALGGAPWWTLNLWPLPVAEAGRKHEIEERLHQRVCAHRMSLRAAQTVFLGNWLRAAGERHGRRHTINGKSVPDVR